MALVYDDVTIDGVTKQAILFDEENSVLLVEWLSAADIANLTIVEAYAGEDLPVTPTLLDKLELATLPNGRKGIDVYGDMLVSVADYSERVNRATINSSTVAAVEALQVTVADHEERIVVLETAP